MKSFSCQKCGQAIFFENDHCLRCASSLGFVYETMTMSAFANKEGVLQSHGNHWLYKYCRNSEHHQACNWVLELTSEHSYCLACRLNRTIPNLSIPENLRYWCILEAGKRRLLYSLIRLGLPVVPKSDDNKTGVAFEFLKDTFERIKENDYVMTGHVDGVITMNIAEADDVERERRRKDMNEDYRTVLGHFRHEIGHYYWQQMVCNKAPLSAFRVLFGDERQDYQKAVTQHYAVGAPVHWPDSFISAYASCHPWEDFAETWGHYLLIADTLETAKEFFDEDDSVDGYHAESFTLMLDRWLPLTLAVNNINRSGGQPDLYPFVLSARTVQKLNYVHQLIHARHTF